MHWLYGSINNIQIVYDGSNLANQIGWQFGVFDGLGSWREATPCLVIIFINICGKTKQ